MPMRSVGKKLGLRESLGDHDQFLLRDAQPDSRNTDDLLLGRQLIERVIKKNAERLRARAHEQLHVWSRDGGRTPERRRVTLVPAPRAGGHVLLAFSPARRAFIILGPPA